MKVYSECGISVGVADPRSAARTWLERGRQVALATVIETWGSAPVRPGGQMAVAGEDEFQGSVSGGCVEAEVIAASLDVIATGKPETMSFGIADETAWRAGLACGGQIKVHVVRLDSKHDLDHLREVEKAVASRTPLVVATRLSDGRREMLRKGAGDAAIEQALVSGQSRVVADPDGDKFLHAIVPSPRLIIVGATHIGQHLAAMATAAGYDVKVIDPRGAFTSASRFNPAQVVEGWPEQCFAKLAADPYAAVVTLTHVDQIDDEALAIALKSKCRYVGSLGSRRTHQKRVDRLKAAGFSDKDIARIHAPVGLSIGAATPGEIATSILAEIIGTFRNGAKA